MILHEDAENVSVGQESTLTRVQCCLFSKRAALCTRSLKDSSFDELYPTFGRPDAILSFIGGQKLARAVGQRQHDLQFLA